MTMITTMTMTAPGQHSVKSRRIKPAQVVRYGLPDTTPDSSRDTSPDSADVVLNPSLDDPTVYPESEDVGREVVENEICLQLQPVLRRHFAERGIIAHVGSDGFIYWVKGDPKACVAPDVYVLPGIAQATFPRRYPGSNDEQCWKTWIHHVVPNFALEVKARPNPRKDELKSPARHDALGTKELIVFDPFIRGRRSHRKRFVVHRRDASGKLVIALATNEDRVYVQELDVFLVAQGYGDEAVLRLALGPHGEKLVPFESELVEIETRRANEEARRANEARSIADEALRRASDLEAELARLRAIVDKQPQRTSKSAKSRLER